MKKLTQQQIRSLIQNEAAILSEMAEPFAMNKSLDFGIQLNYSCYKEDFLNSLNRLKDLIDKLDLRQDSKVKIRKKCK